MSERLAKALNAAVCLLPVPVRVVVGPVLTELVEAIIAERGA
jgi:hypothetical protein